MSAIMMKDLEERERDEKQVSCWDKPVDPSERHRGVDNVHEVAVRDLRTGTREMRTNGYHRGQGYLPAVNAASPYHRREEGGANEPEDHGYEQPGPPVRSNPD